ncbi:MAG: hypothetical protein EOP43_00870 [Sphingobacteriaceae bacterium]|nr:MAG: hypothetical protein EOP43_00870 [Sphingobacteriaceae bacterium]
MKKYASYTIIFLLFSSLSAKAQNQNRQDFDRGWTFNLGDIPAAKNTDFDDSGWRKLNLPHDWSIEGKFSKDNPATPEGGALPGGIGWYRKTFTLPETSIGTDLLPFAS